jgi:hypothetical protein
MGLSVAQKLSRVESILGISLLAAHWWCCGPFC